MPIPNIPPEFDKLSTSEKIEYVQKLWERIAEDTEAVELTEAQRAELESTARCIPREPSRCLSVG